MNEVGVKNELAAVLGEPHSVFPKEEPVKKRS